MGTTLLALAGGVNVSSNGLLTGSGTASGALAVQPGGLLSPGAPIGRLFLTRIIPPTLLGTTLILAGTNGPPNANYTVLASINVALPLSSWRIIATNQFDSSGGFSFTNAVDLGIPQRFFQLEVR